MSSFPLVGLGAFRGGFPFALKSHFKSRSKPPIADLIAWPDPRSPSSALSRPFFGWEGSPTKIDHRKSWHPYSRLSLLEDLETSSSEVENFLRLSDDHEPGFWYEPKACSKAPFATCAGAFPQVCKDIGIPG